VNSFQCNPLICCLQFPAFPLNLLSLLLRKIPAEISFLIEAGRPYLKVRTLELLGLNLFHDEGQSFCCSAISFYIRTHVLTMRLTLGIRSFLQSVSRLLKLATKPGRSELWQSMKICLLGILVIGAVGFVVKLISFVLQGL
jgi:protein translocase SEC61 complex gamma subunit